MATAQGRFSLQTWMPENPHPHWDPAEVGAEQLSQHAISNLNIELVKDFDREMDELVREYCPRCKESWFGMEVRHGVCSKCRLLDKGIGPRDVHLMSDANKMDFGDVPGDLPELTYSSSSHRAGHPTSTALFSATLDR
ncbi:Uu.00g066020.m01.CDS01 [Anthostomella pinea]|uniref:Uu.00g066020.m01.CDS01 n=1 Tax=Anthostomella pinea TaxID=933095 RepID=A0AAI8VTV2_9PEZI|nr:Uu.00g066020.m01.CDS01 [Anthostomella pinea]